MTRGTGGEGGRGGSLNFRGLTKSFGFAGWRRFFFFFFFSVKPIGLKNFLPRLRGLYADAMIKKPSIASQSSQGLTTFWMRPTTASLEPGVRPMSGGCGACTVAAKSCTLWLTGRV